MREMSVAKQRYKAVLAVIANGRMVTEVARDWGVIRQTMDRHRARGGPVRGPTVTAGEESVLNEGMPEAN